MNSSILSSVLVIYGSDQSDTELLVMRVLVGVTNLAVIRDRSKMFHVYYNNVCTSPLRKTDSRLFGAVLHYNSAVLELQQTGCSRAVLQKNFESIDFP